MNCGEEVPSCCVVDAIRVIAIGNHFPEKSTTGIMQASALQIIKTGADHTFILDEDILTKVLLQDKIKDRHICVVSVAGAFRKGKSFLLDFFLRYMNATNVQKQTVDWLGDENEKLSGFSWRGGSERETTGILMWSEIFLYDSPKGEKIAIILLDTQGTFDSKSTMKDCATVFALSTLISSVQIYNLSQNIQEDDLQNLQLFSEYGRLALTDSEEKPFQKLQFLVRDWSCPYEYEYGALGGKELLEKRLKLSDNQHPDLQALREHIKSCFTEIECFLMPYPGVTVTTSPHFDGRLKDITPDFKKSLRDLVPMLLAPENLIKKNIMGQRVKASELIQYFKSYIAIYTGNELPEPKTVFAATAEANNLTAVASAKALYAQLMEEVCGGRRPYLSSEHLYAEHLRIKEKAMLEFSLKIKIGGKEFSKPYRDSLEADLDRTFNNFKVNNESKTIYKAAIRKVNTLATDVLWKVGMFLGIPQVYIFQKVMRAIYRYKGEFSK